MAAVVIYAGAPILPVLAQWSRTTAPPSSAREPGLTWLLEPHHDQADVVGTRSRGEPFGQRTGVEQPIGRTCCDEPLGTGDPDRDGCRRVLHEAVGVHHQEVARPDLHDALGVGGIHIRAQYRPVASSRTTSPVSARRRKAGGCPAEQ